jgi:hypothetical protein
VLVVGVVVEDVVLVGVVVVVVLVVLDELEELEDVVPPTYTLAGLLFQCPFT